VIYLLKTRIVESEVMSVSRKRLCKHASAVTDTTVTINEVLEGVLSWVLTKALSKDSPVVRVKIRVTLQLAVYRQSVRLGDKPLETHDQYILSFFQRNPCGYNPYVTPSLTRRRVCRLQLLLALARAVILGSIFTVSDSRLPQPGERGLRVYILQEQGGTVIPPGIGFHFRRLLRLAGLRWRYSTPSPHGPLSSHHCVLHSCCFSGSTVFAFGKYATMSNGGL
jgi:hypothetical protein